MSYMTKTKQCRKKKLVPFSSLRALDSLSLCWSGERPRGDTPHPRSAAGAKRRYPTSKVCSGGQEEIPHIQGLEQGREEISHVQGLEWGPCGDTSCPRSGAARGQEEIPHVQGLEWGREEISHIQGQRNPIKMVGA